MTMLVTYEPKNTGRLEELFFGRTDGLDDRGGWGWKHSLSDGYSSMKDAKVFGKLTDEANREHFNISIALPWEFLE